MPAYGNGEYPLNLFVHRGGNLYFTPSLSARWDEMVRLGVEKYGVRLWITGDIDGLGGWNVYRPLLPQRRYRAYYGNRAAEPGKSSHGGKFRGQEVFALDISNVNALAPGNQSLANARLTALAKTVGLTVNFVTPTEWWHVGDFNHAWSVPAFGRVTVNPETTALPEQKDEDMLPLYIMDSVDGNDIPGWALLNTRTGKLITMRAQAEDWASLERKQEIANGWGRVWGSAKHCYRQDMLDAVDAIQKTL